MGEFDNKVVCTKSKIVDVADAIRYKLSESDAYTLDEMPGKIRAIDGGGGSAVIQPLSITQNGTYQATGNVDGYSPITVAVHSIEDGVQWMRDFDFTQSENDNVTGLTANTNNCIYTAGTGLVWMNSTSKVDAFLTFNQNYNYDIIFKFGQDAPDFGLTGSIASINRMSNSNQSINLFISIDEGSSFGELCYAIGSGSPNRTGIDVEDLADVEIKIQMRLNASNNWNVTLVIDSMSYSQLIGTIDGKKEWNFVFGKGQYDAFNNWILKTMQLKQIIGDGSTRVLEDKSITTNGTYYPASGYYGFSRVDVNVASTANLQTLNVTTNGTYTPTAPVDGYDEVIVDVAPSKVKISEFDFTGSTPFYDVVKETSLATQMTGLTYIQGTGLRVDARGTRLRTGTNFDYAGIYEMEIKFGTFDRTTPPTGYTNSVLLKVGRSSSYLMLTYNYNSGTDVGKWWIHDQSGNNIYLDYGDNDPYYFENKTLIVTYGARYENGELVRDQNKGYFYVNGVQLNSNGASIVGDVDAQIQVVYLCDSGNNAFLGAVYETLKLWQYFNKYSTPVSLMASPETRTIDEPIENDNER